MRWTERLLGLSWSGIVFAAALVVGTVVSAAVGVGPMAAGNVDDFTVTCTSTAAIIQSPYGQVGYNAFVDDTAAEDVYFGHSDVTSSTGTPKGAGEEIGGEVRYEYCRTASGSVTVRVRAKTATEPDSFAGELMRDVYEVFWPEVFASRTEG